jgi:hypothetical protein
MECGHGMKAAIGPRARKGKEGATRCIADEARVDRCATNLPCASYPHLAVDKRCKPHAIHCEWPVNATAGG